MIDNLEETKNLAQINAKTHEQRGNRLNEELKKLQKDLTLKEPISYVKNQLWNKIIEAINDVWPSIQVIYEQKDLLKATQAEIQKTKDIHALDQIEFHRKISEMLYSTITTKAMSVQKLQNTIINMRDQMKVEKSSSYTKYISIKYL